MTTFPLQLLHELEMAIGPFDAATPKFPATRFCHLVVRLDDDHWWAVRLAPPVQFPRTVQHPLDQGDQLHDVVMKVHVPPVEVALNV